MTSSEKSNTPPDAAPSGTKFSAEIRSVLEFVLQLVVIVGVVLGAKSSLADWYRVPSGSMKPTIQEGDQVMVNKVSYDVRIPFTQISLFRTGEPRRGDIVVFVYPGDGKTDYIKRCVGLPGDQIEINDDVLYINGQAVTLTEVSADRLLPGATLQEGSRLHLEALDAVQHFVFTHESPLEHRWEFSSLPVNSADSSCPLKGNKVPPNCYFMMGDNRAHSADSRSWGFVPRANLRGRAFAVVLSFEKAVWNVRGYRLSRWFSRLDPPSEP